MPGEDGRKAQGTQGEHRRAHGACDLTALLSLPAVPYDASQDGLLALSQSVHCLWSDTAPTTTRCPLHSDTGTCW